MSDIDGSEEEKKRKEDERALWEQLRADARAEVATARGNRDALAQAEAMLAGIEARIGDGEARDRIEAEHAAGDDDAWVPKKDAPLASDGQPLYEGPPARTILRWHAGLLRLAGFAAAVAALIGIGLWMRRGEGAGASPLLYLAAGIVAVVAVIYGQHIRCPRCGSWWARRVVSKAFSHTKTRTSTEHTSSGGHRTVTTTSDIYRAELVCQRCRLRWIGYI